MAAHLRDNATFNMISDTETNGCEVMVPLDSTEQRDLERIESTIAANLAGFFRVGFALMEIKRRNLYRGDYHTFEEYCRKRWEMHKAYAYRLIGAAEVCKHLAPIGDIPLPENECQIRPLAGLAPALVARAWRRACENAGPEGKITGALVQKALEEVTGKSRCPNDEKLREDWQIRITPLLEEAVRQAKKGEKAAVSEIVYRVSLLTLIGNRPPAPEE